MQAGGGAGWEGGECAGWDLGFFWLGWVGLGCAVRGWMLGFGGVLGGEGAGAVEFFWRRTGACAEVVLLLVC